MGLIFPFTYMCTQYLVPGRTGPAHAGRRLLSYLCCSHAPQKLPITRNATEQSDLLSALTGLMLGNQRHQHACCGAADSQGLGSHADLVT
jgi:hypothetical protein